MNTFAPMQIIKALKHEQQKVSRNSTFAPMQIIKALKPQRLHTQTVINVFYRTNPDSCLLFSCLIFDFRQGWQINLIYEILRFIISDNINMIENFKMKLKNIFFCTIKKDISLSFLLPILHLLLYVILFFHTHF